MILRKIIGGLNRSSRETDSAYAISKKQMKAIWTLANRLGLLSEDLHSRIKLITGKQSIRLLSKQEARNVIRDLLDLTHGAQGFEEKPWKEGGGTAAQMDLIHGLSRRLGWNRQQVLGLAKKMYDVQQLGDLNTKQASGLIEALKAIVHRGAA